MDLSINNITKKMTKFPSIFISLFLFFLLLACGEEVAPVTTGSIKGVVYDFDTGAILGQANIHTIPPSSAVTSDTINGEFEIKHVDVGVYRVVAQRTGYDSTSVNITVVADDKSIADIALTVFDSTKVDTSGL